MHTMISHLAEIASGNTDGADVLFLVAVIIFGVSTITAVPVAATADAGKWWRSLVAAAATALSLGWLLL